MKKQDKQKNDEDWDPIKQPEQESFVAGSGMDSNDATMRMSLLTSGPQAVSTPFKDGRHPPLQNRTKDLFENIMAVSQMDQSRGMEVQSKNSFQGNMTSSVFENIRASETRIIRHAVLPTNKPFEFVDETLIAIEDSKMVEDRKKKRSVGNSVDWAAPIHRSPISTSANEKLNHLLYLMASAKKERTLMASNAGVCSPILSLIGQQPEVLPMSDATYVLHRERTELRDATYSIVDSAKQARHNLLGDSMMETPARTESHHSLSNTMNTKPIGALAFNEPMDFQEEEPSGLEACELNPEGMMKNVEVATKNETKFAKMLEVLDRVPLMKEKLKLLDAEMKTTFQNLLSKRPKGH